MTSRTERLATYGVLSLFAVVAVFPLLAETVAAVRATGIPVEVEATGGLTLEVVREYAETGVDYLSVGALTHSSPIVDIALDWVAANGSGSG